MSRREPLRMGVLYILILIIALCLVVLAVLALMTARTSLNLTDRQAEEIHQVYAEETAGQHFLQALDERLEQLTAEHASEDEVVRSLRIGAQNMAVNAANAPGIGIDPDQRISIEGSAEIMEGSAAALVAQDASLGDLEDLGDLVDLGDLDDAGSLGEDDRTGEDSLICALRATFATSDGHRLTCVVGITHDLSYEVLTWSTVRMWDEEQATEQLWQG